MKQITQQKTANCLGTRHLRRKRAVKSFHLLCAYFHTASSSFSIILKKNMVHFVFSIMYLFYFFSFLSILQIICADPFDEKVAVEMWDLNALTYCNQEQINVFYQFLIIILVDNDLSEVYSI